MGRAGDMLKYMSEKGGVALSSELLGAGFSAGLIASLEKNGAIERETRGVYVLPGTLLDDFATVSLRWRRCIVSHGSALYLHGLAPRMPARIEVTVPREYNASGLVAENPGIIVHRANRRTFDLGASEATSPSGVAVRAYDAERCICDLVAARGTDGVDMQLFSHALNGYFERSRGNTRKVESYAEALGVADELRRYMEVLL